MQLFCYVLLLCRTTETFLTPPSVPGSAYPSNRIIVMAVNGVIRHPPAAAENLFFIFYFLFIFYYYIIPFPFSFQPTMIDYG